MVQAGGPAAINGFLYQILNHLASVADIRISGTIAGNYVDADAYVVLEPHDGGDARYEGSNTYVVEQYKARPDGTWSVNTIINEVLTDLRKAVREPTGQRGAYFFVTDGREGRMKTFNEFLTSLKLCAGPMDLDDTKSISFGEGLPNTRRSLFKHIVENTGAKKDERERANEELTVFELLSNFDMRFEVSADDRSKDVERFLRQFAPNLGEEVGIRTHLVGELMSRLARGELRLDPAGIDDLLRKVGLNPERMRKLAVLSATMVPLANEEAKALRYSAASDVRQPPVWPAGKSVLVISGRSGDGKTWQLANTIINLGADKEIALLIRAGGTTEETLARAVRLVWQDGLGETSEKSPNALALHYIDARPGSSGHWLTIGVDDVRSVDLARDLAGQPWERWGMRLVMTVPHAVAGSLKYETPDHIHIHDVGSFTVDEVDALLQAHGQNWADLPRDLQKLLRTPILAGLYVALDRKSFMRAPNSEYEIFERFWQRMLARTQVGDSGILLALAGRVLDANSYPVPRSQWAEVGLVADGFTRLDTVGWLQTNEAGDVALAHDRLLNWAAAKEIVHRYKTTQWTLAQLHAFLQECAKPQWGNNSKRLDYLPMDTFWLLLCGHPNMLEMVSLLESFEETQTFGSYGDGLYRHLLPTLGRRVVPMLMARLDKLGSQDQTDYRARLISDAMVAVAFQEGVDLSREVTDLIASTSILKQQVGFAVLTVKPVEILMDRLWELHCQRCNSLHNEQHRSRFNDYELGHAALKAGVRHCPQWLRNQLHKISLDDQNLPELGYLLSSLDHPGAPNMWLEAKCLLFAHMPKDRLRSLLYCIRRYNDISEADFLVSCLNVSDDSAAGVAFSALVKLDPDRALQYLGDDADGNLLMYRSHWLPDLLFVRPEETRTRLLDIAKKTSEGLRFVQQLLPKRANELNKPLLEFLLSDFKRKIRQNLQATCKGDSIWVTFPLRLFNEISKLELLTVLVEKSEGELEDMLVQIARSRIGRTGQSHDHILEEVRQFLIRLRGNGISELIVAELESTEYWGCHRGLQFAAFGNMTAVKPLEAIARRPIPLDANGMPEPMALMENFSAMEGLASLGADEALENAIWCSDEPSLATELVDLRGTNSPMSKSVTFRAVKVLTDVENATDRDVTRALAVIWLSADPDFIAPLKAALAHIDPMSLAAAYACAALQQMGDDSDEYCQFAKRVLKGEKLRHVGINSFCNAGEKGIDFLVEYLNSLPFNEWQHLELGVLHYLAINEISHGFAVESATLYCLAQRTSLDAPYEIAAELANMELRELILDRAFETASSAPHRTLGAVKGLAKFDIKRAVEAAIRNIKSSTKYERELCIFLVKISPDSAAEILFGLAFEVGRESICASAGRALRRLSPENVSEQLEIACSSARSEVRAIAFELAGWLPGSLLRIPLTELVANETEDTVRSAILDASSRRSNEADVFELLATFRTCLPHKRWSILISILQAGDPVLLSSEEDSLWIGAIFDDVPYMYLRYANTEIKRRIQEIDR